MGPARVIPPARLIFLRHGETDWNAQGRLQGQQDIPLNTRGRVQAARAGKKLLPLVERLEAGGEQLRFIASPLQRTCETMEIARAAMGRDTAGYTTDPRLVELSFGLWAGLTWPEVRTLSPDLAAQREAGKWWFVPPEGESYAMLADRIVPWVREIRQDSVVVAHGGVARVLMAIIGGLSPERAPLADIWQDRPLVFQGERFSWL
jgi:broad specificity phosphatase PhoE